MKRALIASNEADRICEIVTKGQPETPVSPPLAWHDAPDEVDFDWSWNNGAPQAPVVILPSAAELAAAADKQTLAEARLAVSDAAIKLEALKPTAPKSIKDAAAILNRP